MQRLDNGVLCVFFFLISDLDTLGVVLKIAVPDDSDVELRYIGNGLERREGNYEPIYSVRTCILTNKTRISVKFTLAVQGDQTIGYLKTKVKFVERGYCVRQ